MQASKRFVLTASAVTAVALLIVFSALPTTAQQRILPLLVRLEGPTPFQATASCTTTQLSCSTPLYVVPANKRAVIEYFSISTDIRREGGLVDAEIRPLLETTLSGQTVQFAIQPLLVLGNNSIPNLTGQVVRLYADPGTTVTARHYSDYVVSYTVSFSISGRLIDR
jgi:hypothetical protein